MTFAVSTAPLKEPRREPAAVGLHVDLAPGAAFGDLGERVIVCPDFAISTKQQARSDLDVDPASVARLDEGGGSDEPAVGDPPAPIGLELQDPDRKEGDEIGTGPGRVLRKARAVPGLPLPVPTVQMHEEARTVIVILQVGPTLIVSLFRMCTKSLLVLSTARRRPARRRAGTEFRRGGRFRSGRNRRPRPRAGSPPRRSVRTGCAQCSVPTNKEMPRQISTSALGPRPSGNLIEDADFGLGIHEAEIPGRWTRRLRRTRLKSARNEAS